MWDRQLFEQMRLSQQQLHAAVFKHVGQALTRVFRVQRHIRATGLEHRQQPHHHLDGALHRQPHQRIRANAGLDQTMGQAIGAAVQFSVTQRNVTKTQCWCIRLRQHLRFNQLMHPLALRVGALGGIPLVEELLALRGVQRRQVLQGHCRVGHGGAQQVQPMAQHARGGRRVEQVGGIGQGGPEAVAGFLGIQAQVKLGALGFQFEAGHTQARQLLLCGWGLGLVIEHHLKQRVMAKAAFGLQRFDQLLEGQILMGLGFQRAALGVLQQLGEGHLAVEIGLEHLRVDEKADQRFGLDAVAVGDRHADANVRLPAVAIQKYLKRRQQQHE